MSKGFHDSSRNFFFIFGALLILATIFGVQLQRLEIIVFEGNFKSISGPILSARGVFVKDGQSSSSKPIIEANFNIENMDRFERFAIHIPPAGSTGQFYIDNLAQVQTFVSQTDFQNDMERAQGTVGLKIYGRKNSSSPRILDAYEIEYRYPIYP